MPVICPDAALAAERLERSEIERFDLVPCDGITRAPQSRHAPNPASRSASRTTTRSSNGATTPAVSWPCSCPLPAITTTSSGAGERHRTMDRGAPVGIDLDADPGPLEDVLDDRERILAARVVGGHDHVVGALHGDGAHHGPLAAVAIASRAEDADQPAAAELARRLQHDVERVRRVRVVDDHRERLPLVDRLEPPRDPRHLANPLRELVVVDVEQDARRDHPEHVLDVEPTPQRRLDLDPAGREAAARRSHLEPFGTDLGSVGEAEGDQRRAARLDELERQPAAVLVADVHRRRRRLRRP